jgi:methyl-accepting chemotaxis protein
VDVRGLIQGLSNKKLGTRLGASFLIIAAITVLVGAVGISRINAVNNASTLLYRNITLPLTSLGRIAESYQSFRVDLRDARLATNDADREKSEAGYQKTTENLDKAIAEYEQQTTDPELQKQFAVTKQYLSQYRDNVGEYFRINREKDPAKMRAFVADVLTPIANKATESLNQLQRLQVTTAKKVADENDSTTRSATIGMILTILIGAAVAALIGIWLTRSIVRPISAMTEVAAAIAEGDVSQTVGHQSGDEIGQLAESFRSMSAMLRERVDAVEKIAAGDTDLKLKSKSQKDVLAKSVVLVSETIGRLIAECERLSAATMQGNLDVRGDANQFTGGYRDIINGINRTLDEVYEEYIAYQQEGFFSSVAIDEINGERMIVYTTEQGTVGAYTMKADGRAFEFIMICSQDSALDAAKAAIESIRAA